MDWTLPAKLRRLIPETVLQADSSLPAAYASGQLLGALIDREDQPAWARAVARYGSARAKEAWSGPRLVNDAFPRAWWGSGDGQRAVNWNYALRFPGCYRIQQITGNCVEASNGDVGYTAMLGFAIFALKKPINWQGPGSSAFYCFRGHGGQGMDLATAALAHQKHGYAVRKEYCGGKYDLRDTEADQRFGMQYWRNPERELADFLAETRQSPSGKIARLDEDATEESIRSTLKAVLRAGGVLHTGSTATAAKNGDPVSGPANIGAHAQTCFGFDDTDEFRSWYQTKTGKRLTEEVYLFDQTHGAVNYVRSNWPSHLWGQPTQGIFVLPWQYAKRLILSTCFCYWPDLGGVTPDQVFRAKGV